MWGASDPRATRDHRRAAARCTTPTEAAAGPLPTCALPPMSGTTGGLHAAARAVGRPCLRRAEYKRGRGGEHGGPGSEAGRQRRNENLGGRNSGTSHMHWGGREGAGRGEGEGEGEASKPATERGRLAADAGSSWLLVFEWMVCVIGLPSCAGSARRGAAAGRHTSQRGRAWRGERASSRSKDRRRQAPAGAGHHALGTITPYPCDLRGEGLMWREGGRGGAEGVGRWEAAALWRRPRCPRAGVCRARRGDSLAAVEHLGGAVGGVLEEEEVVADLRWKKG